MNTKTKQYFLGILGVWALLGGLFAGINNTSATDATATCINAVWTATLTGEVTTNGDSVEAWFDWGDNTSLPKTTPHQNFNSTSNYQQVLVPLDENTTYYYEAVAQKGSQIIRGGISSFRTGQCSTPNNPPPNNLPVSVSINANPSNINSGGRSDLSWSSSNATGCTATSGGPAFYGQGLPTNGGTPVYPTSDTTYRITCYNDTGGSAHADTTVTVNTVNTPSANIQPGTLTYACLYNPFRIQLNWTSGVNANSNGLQKADVNPNDPNRFWDWLPTNDTQRSYTDSNVSQGTSYTYRVKYAPSVPSNEVVTNCGGTTTQTGTIQGYKVHRVSPSDLRAFPAGTRINVSGASSTSSIDNPYGFTLSTGSYTVTADNVAGFTLLGYTLCVNSTSCHSGTPHSGNSVNINVAANNSYDLWWQYQANDVATQTGRIEGFKVTGSNLTPVNGGTVSISGPTSTSSTTNPYGFTVPVGQYTVSANNFSGYTVVGYTLCVNSITCHNSTPQSGNSVNINVASGSSYDLWWHYAEVTQNNPPTVSISANPSNINYGGSSTLTWNSTNATSCTASNGWSGAKNTSGSASTGALNNSTTFTINCSNQYGSATDSTVVTVGGQQNQPTVDIIANPMSVVYNGTTAVTWNPTNATSCNATGGSVGWTGGKNTSGGTFTTGSLTSTTTYSITCTNQYGSASDSVTVSVNGQQNQPTVDIRADETNIDEDDSTYVRWDSNNATSCTASNGWSGSKNINGSYNTGSLNRDTTYTITCTNQYGSATDSVTVRIDDNNNNQGPDVTTRTATGVDSDSATLNGRVDGNGLTTRAWFEYGTSRNMSEETRDRSYGSGSTTYDQNISGLRPNTTYYFRAVAENSEDIAYGNILSFYTGDDYVQPPTQQKPTVVLTADQTSLSYNRATTIRWYSLNATSCYASGGSIGWAGTKSIGTGASYTGALTSSKTYSMTCTNQYGSSTDSITVLVRGQVLGTTSPTPSTNALILLSSAVDRYQAIVPTLDNTRPHPGDEINYTITYQNVGNGSATNLVLRLDLPYEVDYMSSNPNNPIRSGQTLIFNLGTLKPNGSGTVSVRVRVRNDIPGGTILNFPATLSYVDPAGYPQSVSSNISATVWTDPLLLVNQNYQNYDNQYYNQNDSNKSFLGASVIGSGFFPGSLFEWLLLLILILVLIVLIKYIFNQPQQRQVIVAH